MGDLQTFSDEDGKRGEQSGIVTMFDIWWPVVESAVLFPCRHTTSWSGRSRRSFSPRYCLNLRAFGLQKWPNLNATVAQWIGDDAAADSTRNGGGI